ncbi:MAG TPA: hypothetical protein VIX18_11140, partial [Nitrospirota bacterium]
MNSDDKTTDAVMKLLPKKSVQEPDREPSATTARQAMLSNAGLALAVTLMLAFVLLPRTPHLAKGDIAPRNVVAPYTLYVEYPGPDQTVLSFKVNKGEIIIESGRRVTEKAARVLEEIASREGVGTRLQAYLGLVVLVLALFYIFYRDIKRYRPTLLTDTKKMFLLAFLLIVTVIISQFARFILS